MEFTLPETVIRKRLEEWHNWSRELPHLRAKCRRLEAENRALKAQMRTMKKEYEAKIETLELRVEQLATIVFGPPRRDRLAQRGKRDTEKEDAERQERLPATYRRAIPRREEVTATNVFPLTACPDCGGTLASRRIVRRYVEDMLLPRPGQSLKTVEERRIGCGYCRVCHRQVSAIPYGPQDCELGPNVRMYIVYAITILGQTWEKVRIFLHDVCGIALSDGEIAVILREQRQRLLPREQEIEARIRGSPAAHYDETGWAVQQEPEGRFGWVKTASATTDTLFRLGRTRGRGNAEELRGDDTGQPSITDDFASYHAVFRRQGLCWAHVLRKVRDLAQSRVFTGRTQARCTAFYADFRTLLHDVRAVAEGPFHPADRARKAAAFSRRIAVLCRPTPDDPPKLRAIAEKFLVHRTQYLLCVREKDVPMTNNKAEHALRPLVIKRKLSFGSKTQRGAQVMETLLSVVFTLWWSRPQNFFAAYRRLLQPA